MAIPPVKMQIVLGGVKEVQRSLKTLKKALTDLEKTYVTSQQKANNKVDSDFKESMHKRTKLIKEYERSYIRSLDRIERAEHKANRFSTSSSGGIGRVRSSRIGLGGGGGGGISGALGAAGAGAAALGAAGVAAAAGLWVLSKAVTYVTDVIQQNATEMVSGITQIGGGFSISDAMAGSAASQRLAVQIAQNAGKEDPISSGQVGAWSQQMGATTEFRQLEWTKALKAFQTPSGKVSGFKNNAEFFGKLASASGTDLEQLATAAGLLKKQFEKLSDTDIQDLMLKMWESGKEGVIEMTDQGKLSEITGFAGMFGGDKKKTIMDLVGGAQMVAPMVGGSASEAVTRIKAQLTEIIKDSAAVKKIVGRGTLTTDEEGKSVYRNVNAAYATAAYLAQTKQLGKLPNVRSKEGATALGNVATAGGMEQKKGESTQKYLARLEKFFEGVNKVEGSMSDLDKAFAETKNTVEYKLKTMFNKLGGDVGGKLLDTLDANSDKIKDFFDKLIEAAPMLTSQFLLMFAALQVLNAVIEAAMPLFFKMAKIAAAASGDPRNYEKVEKLIENYYNEKNRQEQEKRDTERRNYEETQREGGGVSLPGPRKLPASTTFDFAGDNGGVFGEAANSIIKASDKSSSDLSRAASNLDAAANKLKEITIIGDPNKPEIKRTSKPNDGTQ